MGETFGPSQLTITEIAAVCHEANRTLCLAQGDTSQLPWTAAPAWQRDSAEAGVRAIINNPSITPEQQHDAWSADKRAAGWAYGEVKDAEKKTHHCLVPYDQLPAAQRVKDALFQGVARALLFEAHVPTAV